MRSIKEHLHSQGPTTQDNGLAKPQQPNHNWHFWAINNSAVDFVGHFRPFWVFVSLPHGWLDRSGPLTSAEDLGVSHTSNRQLMVAALKEARQCRKEMKKVRSEFKFWNNNGILN